MPLNTLFSAFPKMVPLSKNIPNPALIEVLPLLHGSHATPNRGAIARLNSGAILSPNCDLWLSNPAGGCAKIYPFRGSKFGLHALVRTPVGLLVTSGAPVEVMQGAFAGSHRDGSKFSSSPKASVG